MESNQTKSKTFDVKSIKADFPALTRELRPGIRVVYLDSAATSQKPKSVIEAMDRYYREYNANIHRGIHTMAEEATAAYESARERIAHFIKSPSNREVIFTRNTTESINLVAQSWGRANLKSGDVIVLTQMEHHSNLIPWQLLASEKDLRLEFIPVTEDGLLDIESYKALLKLDPKLVAFTQMSNVLGTINPAKEIVSLAHDAGSLTMIDAAQSVPHIPVDVEDLNTDFLAFSGHKMCGPNGIGVLYGREELLDRMPPFLGGGDMIKRVELRSFTTNDLPHKFEAGTPAIAETIGLGAAVDYLSEIGMEAVARHEHEIISYTLDRLSEVPGLQMIGPSAENKGGVAAFSIHGIHPHDISQILDTEGIAVRAGHHCAMPLHKKLSLIATARASFYLYNEMEEVDKLAIALNKVIETFGL